MRPNVGCDGFIVDRDSMYTAHLVLLYLAKKLPGTIVPGDSEISRVQLLSFTRTCATVERDADDSNHSTFLYVESSKAVSGTQLRARAGGEHRTTGKQVLSWDCSWEQAATSHTNGWMTSRSDEVPESTFWQ